VFTSMLVNNVHWYIAVFQCSLVFSRTITSSAGISGGLIFRYKWHNLFFPPDDVGKLHKMEMQ
jgi:hypothetical protein